MRRLKGYAKQLSLLLPLYLCCAGTGWSSQPGPPEDLADLTLEQLMQIEVTSVSRKEQKLSKAAAAIYVITQEDIRRSGLTSIPEILRMAPGLHVAQIDGNKWAISSRGFNGRYANKMLVLIDGRSIYTPLFSGVYWEMHDLMLEDIERIEVIRGPGATMWGANAVNGVVNIMTKSAKDTQGGVLTAGGGNVERMFGGLRYGGSVGPKFHYRIYSKYSRRDDMLTAERQKAGDGWESERAGFRADWQLSETDSLTLLGGLFQGSFNETPMIPIAAPPWSLQRGSHFDASTGDVLARWTRRQENSETSLQAYYDRMSRPEHSLRSQRDTVDFEFRNRSLLRSRQELSWGLGYRYSTDSTEAGPNIHFSPASRGVQFYSGFLQDEIQISGDRLLLTLGSKLEHNDFTGFELQPTARLLWNPSNSHSLWTSISRAVRTPSRTDHDATIWAATIPPFVPSGVPMVIHLIGNPGFVSEAVVAAEAGYRVQAGKRISFDLATFYNRYRNLRDQEPGIPTPAFYPAPHLVLPYIVTNGLAGRGYGAEIAAVWKATAFWRLSATYSWLQVKLKAQAGGDGPSMSGGMSLMSPHQAGFRSYLDLPGKLQLDTSLHFTDALHRLVSTAALLGHATPSVCRFDTRFGWHPTRNVELSLTWQNLLDDRHPEYRTAVFRPSEIRRGVYGKVTWRF